MSKPFTGQVAIQWLPKDKVKGLSEIYSQGWQCAFVSADNRQATQYVLCKDFLQDAVRAFLYGTSAEIYGFRYNPKENPPLDIKVDYQDIPLTPEEIAAQEAAALAPPAPEPPAPAVPAAKKGYRLTGLNSKSVNKKPKEAKPKGPKQLATVTGRCRIVTTNQQDANFLSKTANVLDFLHQFERHLDLDLTEAYQVTNPEGKYAKCGAVLYVTTTRWLEAPPMLSLYTLLLRVGCVHQIGDTWEQTLEKVSSGKTKPYQSNDASYLKSSLAAIKQIMKIGYRCMFLKDPKKNYPEKVSIGTLHNSTGIVALATGQTKEIVKYWTRKELAEKPTLEARRAAQAAGVQDEGEE